MMRPRAGAMVFMMPIAAGAQIGQPLPAPANAPTPQYSGVPVVAYPADYFPYSSQTTVPYYVPPYNTAVQESDDGPAINGHKPPDKVLLATTSLVLLLWAPVWQLGAYNEIFFDVYLQWAFVLTTIVCAHSVQQKWVDGRWYATIAAAVAALVLLFPAPSRQIPEAIYTAVVGLMLLIATPLILRILFQTMSAETVSLTKKQLLQVASATAVVLVIVFLIGWFHPVFMSCKDFTIAGYSEPAGCRNTSLYSPSYPA